MDDKVTPDWFVIMDGSSPDGRGDSRFVCRTTDAGLVRAFLKKNQDNPYWTGFVLVIRDRGIENVSRERDL